MLYCAAGEEVKGAPCGKCFQLNSTHIPTQMEYDFEDVALFTKLSGSNLVIIPYYGVLCNFPGGSHAVKIASLFSSIYSRAFA